MDLELRHKVDRKFASRQPGDATETLIIATAHLSFPVSLEGGFRALRTVSSSFYLFIL